MGQANEFGEVIERIGERVEESVNMLGEDLAKVRLDDDDIKVISETSNTQLQEPEQ